MVATRFAVAAHILLLLAANFRAARDAQFEFRGALARSPAPLATSGRLALIVNTNPVVVRRIAGQLARAGLIRVHRGPGGADLARPPEEITLDDVWRAVNAGSARPLVPLHARAPGQDNRPGSRSCGPLAHDILAAAFGDAEAAFRESLGHTTLDTLAQRLTTQEPAREIVKQAISA